MENLSNFLNKYKKIVKSDKDVKEIILRVFKDILNSDLNLKDFNINNDLIIIKCNPTLKSEIFINKKKILENIKEKTKLVFKNII